MFRVVITALLVAASSFAQLVPEVRAAASAGDWAKAERLIAEHRKAKGVTPEMILAVSWIGRNALFAKDYERAEKFAGQTRELALAELKKRAIDAEKDLPLALGASIEVHAQALAGQGRRSEGVAFLKDELARWKGSSMRQRIQKNINLLSLEGQQTPPLELSEIIGPKPLSAEERKGRPALMFFWAHWCGDCKQQAPIIARLKQEIPSLYVIAPTQRYGYAARGEDASPQQERSHIEKVWKDHYSQLAEVSVPISQDNFNNYGCSTTPTLVLLDGKGTVRMYHPGKLSYEDLKKRIAALTGS